MKSLNFGMENTGHFYNKFRNNFFAEERLVGQEGQIESSECSSSKITSGLDDDYEAKKAEAKDLKDKLSKELMKGTGEYPIGFINVLDEYYQTIDYYDGENQDFADTTVEELSNLVSSFSLIRVDLADAKLNKMKDLYKRSTELRDKYDDLKDKVGSLNNNDYISDPIMTKFFYDQFADGLRVLESDINGNIDSVSNLNNIGDVLQFESSLTEQENKFNLAFETYEKPYKEAFDKSKDLMDKINSLDYFNKKLGADKVDSVEQFINSLGNLDLSTTTIELLQQEVGKFEKQIIVAKLTNKIDGLNKLEIEKIVEYSLGDSKPNLSDEELANFRKVYNYIKDSKNISEDTTGILTNLKIVLNSGADATLHDANSKRNADWFADLENAYNLITSTNLLFDSGNKINSVLTDQEKSLLRTFFTSTEYTQAKSLSDEDPQKEIKLNQLLQNNKAIFFNGTPSETANKLLAFNRMRKLADKFDPELMLDADDINWNISDKTGQQERFAGYKFELGKVSEEALNSQEGPTQSEAPEEEGPTQSEAPEEEGPTQSEAPEETEATKKLKDSINTLSSSKFDVTVGTNKYSYKVENPTLSKSGDKPPVDYMELDLVLENSVDVDEAVERRINVILTPSTYGNEILAYVPSKSRSVSDVNPNDAIDRLLYSIYNL